MELVETHFDAVKVLRAKRHGDARGFFAETYSARDFAVLGIVSDFVQDNHSLSRKPGVIRGLHFQLPPLAQAKLVRVVRGSVLDAVVDIRRSSSSFGRHATRDPVRRERPPAFRAAWLRTRLLHARAGHRGPHKVDAYYAPEHERGLAWDDPALAIPWPVAAGTAEVSEKDRRWPALSGLKDMFE